MSLRRLYALRNTFRGLFLDYRNFEKAGLALDDVQTFRHGMLPLRWAYVALESGLFIVYPATIGLQDQFEARKRPWYLAGRQGAGELRNLLTCSNVRR